MFGTIDQWFFEHLAGLQVGEPGYRLLRIRPVLPRGLSWVDASITTPYGPARSRWRRSDDSVAVTVDVPPGTAAEVHLPGPAASWRVGEGTAEPGTAQYDHTTFRPTCHRVTFESTNPT